MLCLFLDILSKQIVVHFLYGQPPVKIIGHYVQFLLIYNRGALFGVDPRHFLPWFPLNAFFFFFSILAVVVIVIYFSRLHLSDILMRWGLTLILPGALGNFIDRLIHPKTGVVDFIRVGISETVYWPIFNLADAYVTVGIALVFIHFLLEERQKACKKNL